jgi:hypothetical protein
VQQVREAARRSSCLNNLKQIGLGALNFESSYMHFPTTGLAMNGFSAGVTGASGQPNVKSITAVENLSWGYQILPFIEASNLHALRADFGLVPQTFGESLPIYSCPTRGSRVIINNVGDRTFYGDYASFLSDGVLAKRVTDNFGITVINPVTSGSVLIRGNASEASDLEEYVYQGIIGRGGVYESSTLFEFAKVGFGSIEDGSSNTMMFAEKHIPADLYDSPSNPTEAGGIYAGGYSAVRRHTDGPYSDGITSDHPNYKKFSQNQSFGSAHPGTYSSVFGDGSVHSLSLEINALNFFKIGHRADGLIVDHDEF